MKFSKLCAIGSLLAAAFLFVSRANAAPTVVFAGAGSSAIFNSLYDAALNSGVCGPNLWSAGGGNYPTFTKGGTVHDNRNGFGTTIPDDNQKVWVSFDGTAANNFTDTTAICLYVAVDSSVGVRGFLAGVRASVELSSGVGATAGNQVKGYADNVATLPQAIWNDINVPGSVCAGTTQNTCTTVTGTVMNAAGADIRPEDAQYATYRSLSARAYNGAGTTPANPTYYSSTNLGYGNWSNPYAAGSTLSGTSILSSFSTTAATPTYFEQVVGAADAIHGTVGQYAVYPLGVDPIIVAVSNTDTTANVGFGNGVPGNYQLRNAGRFNLSYVFDGTLTRTRDLIGVTGAASKGIEVIEREPLSGTYNTFEFSVPRTHDVQGSQEDGVWPSLANMNPLNIAAASGGLRLRAIGTGEMVSAINGLATTTGLNTILPNRIGYFFWSYSNIAALTGVCTSSLNAGLPVSTTVSCTTNPGAHYLLLDGVDPLFNTEYDNPEGPLNPPVCNFASLPCPTIPFTHLKDGSYSAWNIIRLVVDPSQTTIQTPVTGCSGFTGINAIYCTFETVSATKYSDILPATQLIVFRDHKGAGWGQQGVAANGYAAVNGTLCTPSSPTFGYNYTGQDMGSDVGGAIFNITADQDYAFDFQGGLTPSSTNCGQSVGANEGLVGQVQ